MFENGWINFIAAFAVFFASHMVLVRPPVRPWLVQILGKRGFSISYSLLSILILWWLIEAAQAAPYVELWAWEPWQNWIPILTMLPVCVIVSLGVGVPNPFSFAGLHNDRFDPQRPGLIRFMRHPVLVALFLWSAAHLIANGNLAHVILFGAFALFSLAGVKIIDKRRQRELGPDWVRLLETAQKSPLSTAFAPKTTFVRVVLALAVYAILVHLHPYFAGVAPFA